MILTRTPFRVSLAGGGTDLPSFSDKHGGFCIGMTINKYMYVTLNTPSLSPEVRLHYSHGETVAHVSELRHDLAREALRAYGLETHVEVSSIADLPASAGMGSSAAYLVGLLAALSRELGATVRPEFLAWMACWIELNELKRPVGRQDQYLCAVGGLNMLTFGPEDTVQVEPLPLSEDKQAELTQHLRLYYVGGTHDAGAVLSAVAAGEDAEAHLLTIKTIAERQRDSLIAGDFDSYGYWLAEQWTQKRLLSPAVSTPEIDAVYEASRAEYGVLGGRLIGAGGCGVLMLYCPKPAEYEYIDAFMAERGYPRIDYGVDRTGVQQVLLSSEPQWEVQDEDDAIWEAYVSSSKSMSDEEQRKWVAEHLKIHVGPVENPTTIAEIQGLRHLGE